MYTPSWRKCKGKELGQPGKCMCEWGHLAVINDTAKLNVIQSKITSLYTSSRKEFWTGVRWEKQISHIKKMLSKDDKDGDLGLMSPCPSLFLLVDSLSDEHLSGEYIYNYGAGPKGVRLRESKYYIIINFVVNTVFVCVFRKNCPGLLKCTVNFPWSFFIPFFFLGIFWPDSFRQFFWLQLCWLLLLVLLPGHRARYSYNNVQITLWTQFVHVY